MNKKFIVMAAFAALFGMGFTACSNDDDLGSNAGVEQKGEGQIGFGLTLDNGVTTRGLAANVADINVDGFKVWAFDARTANTYYMGTSSTGIACEWNSTDELYEPAVKYYWPEYNLSFLAHTPQTGGGIGEISVTSATAAQPGAVMNVSIPTTLNSQRDIMFAAANSKHTPDASVAMTFKHALSQLVFKGKIDYTSNITKVVVSNISLVNVATDGTITVTSAADAATCVAAVDGGDDYSASMTAKLINATINTDYKTEAGTTYQDITGGDVTDELAYTGATTRTQQMMILPQTVNTSKADGDISLVAPAFDAETPYEVGKYVVYSSKLYKCTTAHAAGAWDADDFTAVGAYLLVNADLYANNDDSNKVLENTTNVYIPLNETTWAPGYKYTYILEFGENLLKPITFTSSITGWSDASKDVTF